MNIFINCNAPVIGRYTTEELVREWYGPSYADEPWVFSPDDYNSILMAKKFLDGKFDITKDWHKCALTLIIRGLEAHDPEEFYRLSFTRIADTLMGSDRTRPWDARKRCKSCGNMYVDQNYEPLVNISKMPKKAPFFSLDGNLKLFAHDKFINDYNRLGLTGLTFSPFHEDLFRVNVKMHVWSSQSGVCELCGMKTNVTRSAFFNLMEDYKYDFQFIRINPGYVTPHEGPYATPMVFFILSPKAAKLIRSYAKAAGKMDYCIAPIIPGYMADKFYPQDCLFKNGNFPMTVFRS